MKIKLSINGKMLVYVLFTTVLIFAFSVGYISLKTRGIAIDDAEKLTLKVASENALRIEKDLSENLQVLRALSQAFAVYEDMEEAEWKDLFLKMYMKVFENNPDFYKLWDSWELKHFDPNWDKNYGRYAVTVFRQMGEITYSTSIRSLEGDNALYGTIKRLSCDMLWEPYWDAFVEEAEVKKFMTSLSSPIYKNNQFAGIVAADLLMDKFQKLVADIKPFEQTQAILTSNNGIISGHTNNDLIGESVADIYPEYQEQVNLVTLIKEGKQGVFQTVNKDGKKELLTIVPIKVGESQTPWSLMFSVPVKVILKEANRMQWFSLFVSFLGLLILSIIIYLLSRSISTSLLKTTDILEKLSVGDIENLHNLDLKTGDELEMMARSVNVLKQGLEKTSIFAENIGLGNLDAEFEPLSEKDVLGNALLEMRKSLKHADEEEKKRKIEDEKQNWATQGLAKFGDILRTSSNNIEELAFNFMSNLINYLDVNQGALFIIDDNNEGELALELKSAIAYGRDKYLRKRVNVGEELVGRCAFEKKTIYMTDIPEDYIQITSGMGTANPTALLLVPLILNDEIFGVIELASFHEIEKYRIEFVEKLGESIASTIATVRVNEKTNKLLEQSKGQAEELAAQEEEMRQNLEELQATQEEAARREYETTGIINAVGVVAFTVEYDVDGVIVNCNNKFADMLGLSPEQIIGQKHSQGYEFSDEMKASYDKFWSDLLKGKTIRQTNKIKMNGREAWIDETYTPIKNQSDGKTYKILKIGFDVTEQIQKESKIKDQEIKIKKESMLLSEYQDRIQDLQKQLQAAQLKVEELEMNRQSKKTVEHQVEEVLIIPATGDNLLDWLADFELGIQEMDEQHKQLIDLVNAMHASLKQGKNKKEVKDNIRSFVDFASYHFGNEEQYFEQFGFSDTKDHTQEHKAFVKEILQFQSDYSANKIKFLDDFMQFIKKWLHKHFSVSDKKYAALFKQNGL
ncbi:MAG: hypothetical protein CVU09_00550 [Bacteroidetes bacterium HGW-Bacteroidetes-4]|jgi:methyl-accepting chemotaxis protein|nr:MAG: hypothetical protein CVU09_00550 [Bacteroidetes bacterium HGW-Bacteroidetes-4]